MTALEIGLIAGSGQYPVHLAKRLLGDNYNVTVAGIFGLTTAADYRNCRFKNFYIGQIKAACDWFRSWDVNAAVMAGGIRLKWGTVIKPDIALLPAMPALLLRGDDWRLRYLALLFEKRGIAVRDPRQWITDWFAPKGHLAGPSLDAASERLLARGISVCAKFVEGDAGQAVLVHGKDWVATEDGWGTDALLKKAPGKGAILIKMKKRKQDMRFDIPSVGPETIRHAKKAGVAAIAIQANAVILIERHELMHLCRVLNVSLVAFECD